MSCCTSFSATSTSMRLDPGRHVNFTTGMVLGAEDYRQQQAYSSGRDKWIVRDFHGYGTLNGLEVTLENDGERGPMVRVTGGSAAAPSGQLICVGREQCGGINQWMATEEVAATLDAMSVEAGGTNSLRFPIWLVLCYRDCAIAPVPVPGEPCRSDEELMVPSRIADDYTLSFAFDPPTMTEAEGIAKLNAWVNSLAINEAGGAETDDLDGLIATATEQLDAIFPSVDLDAEPVVPDSLDPLNFVPDLAAGFFAAIKRLWITRWRPRVVAVSCNSQTTDADDCVMLARIEIGAERATNVWEVANLDEGGEITGIDASLDQSDRPLLLASNVEQTPAGLALSDSGFEQQLALIGGDGSTEISNGFVVIVGDDPLTLQIPGAEDENRDHTLIVRLASATGSSITPNTGDIAGDSVFELDGLSEVHLRSNGSDNWAVIRTIARGGG